MVDLRRPHRCQSRVSGAGWGSVAKRCIRDVGHDSLVLHCWLEAQPANGYRRLVTWGDDAASILTWMVMPEGAAPAPVPVELLTVDPDTIWLTVRILGQSVWSQPWPAHHPLPARGDVLDVPELGAVMIIDRYMMTGGSDRAGLREVTLNAIAAAGPAPRAGT